MNRSFEFSLRYHQLKESLQKVVEIEYAKATSAVRSAEDALLAARQSKESARASMSGATNLAEWHLWYSYVAALENAERDREDSKQAADRQQQQVKEEVGAAFRETYKWGLVVDKLRTQVESERLHREQTTADDLALQRHREER